MQHPALEDQYLQISNLIEIQRVGADFIITDGQTGRQRERHDEPILRVQPTSCNISQIYLFL
jgi:hypothetical protein